MKAMFVFILFGPGVASDVAFGHISCVAFGSLTSHPVQISTRTLSTLNADSRAQDLPAVIHVTEEAKARTCSRRL